MKSPRALREQVPRDFDAERFAIRSRRFRAHDAPVVRRSHQPLQMQRRPRAAREGRHRHVATAVQRAVHRALGFDAFARGRIVERGATMRRSPACRRDIRSRSRPAPARATTRAHPGACGCAIRNPAAQAPRTRARSRRSRPHRVSPAACSRCRAGRADRDPGGARATAPGDAAMTCRPPRPAARSSMFSNRLLTNASA